MAELVARRYAQALFEVAFEENTYEPIKDELQFVVDTLNEYPQFYEILRTPLIDLGEKKEIVSSVFKGRINQILFNFLYVLLDKGRQNYIEEINREYRILAAKAKNKVEAVAITAVPMNQDTLLRLQVNLSMASGKNVQLTNKVDPNVIGGVRVEMGDQVIDGTLKARLDQVKEQLSQIIL